MRLPSDLWSWPAYLVKSNLPLLIIEAKLISCIVPVDGRQSVVFMFASTECRGHLSSQEDSVVHVCFQSLWVAFECLTGSMYIKCSMESYSPHKLYASFGMFKHKWKLPQTNVHKLRFSQTWFCAHIIAMGPLNFSFSICKDWSGAVSQKSPHLRKSVRCAVKVTNLSDNLICELLNMLCFTYCVYSYLYPS